jgi:hypothetical protein
MAHGQLPTFNQSAVTREQWLSGKFQWHWEELSKQLSSVSIAHHAHHQHQILPGLLL